MSGERLRQMREAAARREHGSRARYIAGCRCLPCRAANSRYECRRAVLRLAGRSNGIVSAESVRRHILALGRLSVGYKAVAKAAGVAKSIVFGIRTGARPNCRRQTERAILAVGVEAIAGAIKVHACGTWRLLDGLLRDGYSKAQIARWLGLRSPALQFSRDRVTAATARAVARMHEDVRAGRLRRDR